MAITGNDRVPVSFWIHATVILIAISIKNNGLYHKIGKSTVIPNDLKDFIDKLDFSSSHDSFSKEDLIIISMAFLLRNGANDEENQIAGICEPSLNQYDDDFKIMNILNELRKRVGDNNRSNISGFYEIYTKLEKWKPFIED